MLLYWKTNILSFDFHILHKGMFYVVNFLGNISHWIIVCFSIDRFIAVSYPLKSIQWLTTSKTKVCIAIVCGVAFIKNLHYLWTTDFFYNTKTGAAICAFGLKNKASWVPVYQSFEVTISSLLPFLIIAFCNVMIVKKIRRRSKNADKLMETRSNSTPLTSKKIQNDQQSSVKSDNDQYPAKDQHSTISNNNLEIPVNHKTKNNINNKNNSNNSNNNNNNNKTTQQQGDQNITKILLLVSTVFILTTSPLLIFRLYFANKDISNSDAQTQAWYWLGHHVCHKLWYTNNGINFFLYCWFSKSFRIDLKRILSKRFNRRVCAMNTTATLNTTTTS